MPREQNLIDAILKLIEELSAAERRELLDQLAIEHLRDEIDKGIADAERGAFRPAEEVFHDLKRRNHARRPD